MPAAPDQRRRDLARIHTLARQRELIVDTADGPDDRQYRKLLTDLTGHSSAAALDANQRRAVITAMAGQRSGTAHTRLLRHIWGRMHTAGAVASPAGLNAWCEANTRRDTRTGEGYRAPEFAPGPVRARLIEQLKQWAAREGVTWR